MNPFEFIKYLLDTYPQIIEKYPIVLPTLAIMSNLAGFATILIPVLIALKRMKKGKHTEGDDEDSKED